MPMLAPNSTHEDTLPALRSAREKKLRFDASNWLPSLREM
jgi:hypothetical protein